MNPCIIAVSVAVMLANGQPGRPHTRYIGIGTNVEFGEPVSDPKRPLVRSEILTSRGPIYSTSTPEQIAKAPCIDRPQPAPVRVRDEGRTPG